MNHLNLKFVREGGYHFAFFINEKKVSESLAAGNFSQPLKGAIGFQPLAQYNAGIRLGHIRRF